MTSIPDHDDILDSLFHNADYRIMPTETLVIEFFGTFTGPLGSPAIEPTPHNPHSFIEGCVATEQKTGISSSRSHTRLGGPLIAAQLGDQPAVHVERRLGCVVMSQQSELCAHVRSSRVAIP
jgi:hypothetical protein